MGATSRRIPYKSRLPLDVREAIDEAMLLGFASPADIRLVLERRGLSRVPDDRTIRAYVRHRARDLLPPAEPDPWDVLAAPAEQVAAIGHMAAWLYEETVGRVWPSHEAAGAMQRLVLAGANAGPVGLYVAAVKMLRARANGDEAEVRRLFAWAVLHGLDEDEARREAGDATAEQG